MEHNKDDFCALEYINEERIAEDRYEDFLNLFTVIAVGAITGAFCVYLFATIPMGGAY